MNDSPTNEDFQQENIELRNEIEELKKDNEALANHLGMVKTLFWASQDIASEDNLLYALNQLLYKVMKAIEANDASISHFDSASQELVFLLVHGELSQQLSGYRIKSDAGIAGWVAQHHQPIIVNDPREDWRFSQAVDKEFSFFTQSIISVPVMRRGQFLGVIQLLNKRGNEFTQADVALLLILGQVTGIVFEEIKNRIESGRASREDFFDL